MVVVHRNLTKLKTTSIFKINQAIGKVRENYITVLPGQEMLYLSKEQEARTYISATSPNISEYPLIAAEIGITGETALEVATVYVTMANQWKQLAAALESLRLGSIAAVENATTVVEINQICSNLEQALQGLEV
jgi:plasmid maintenance system antidote protein VapI